MPKWFPKPENGGAISKPGQIEIPSIDKPRLVINWKIVLAIAGSALSSAGLFTLSQYLTARGFVSITLARVLLLVAWLCFSGLVILVVKAFELKRELLCIAIGIGTITTVLGGLELWATLRGDSMIAGFAISIHSVFLYEEPAPRSLFMVGYRSSHHGFTVSPVPYLLYLSIENTQDIANTVEAYSLAVRDGLGWRSLVPISLASSAVYQLPSSPEYYPDHPRDGATIPPLFFGRGFYRVNGPLPDESMSHAFVISLEPQLELEMSKTLQPHQSITGWAAFDVPDRAMERGLSLRLTVRYVNGATASRSVELKDVEPYQDAMDTQPAQSKATGDIADLSNAYQKFYGEP